MSLDVIVHKFCNPRLWRRRAVWFLAFCAAFLLISTTSSNRTQAANPPIAFVQGNFSVPATPQGSVVLAYAAAQKAGDLNVVVVGWSDSTTMVSSVTDSNGNTYSLAVGPTVQSSVQSQSIYYAKNIAAAVAGGNAVNVKFSASASFIDIRILEYSGLDTTNPLDVATGAFGNGTLSKSGNVATTNANDLLVGANIVTSGTTGAGTGFTKRMITSPNGDIAEDNVVTATGSYNATAPMSSGGWVMQIAAFRQAGSGGTGGGSTPTAPGNLTATAASSTQINLSWTASTETGGTIGNYLVERCQGSGCTSFAQIGTSTTTTFNDTGLTGSTSYSYRVRASDTSNNTGPYSNTATATTSAAAPAIAFVQVNSAVPSTAQSSVSVPFKAAQNAGDLIVVVAGWSDSTSTVSSVTDSSGNIYSVAAGPTRLAGVESQSIYFAKNIAAAAANANIVTVNFSAAVSFPDIRVLEYSGVDQSNPLDTSAGASGNSSTSDSGPVTTSHANDLIFGANYVTTVTTNAGTGFTKRIITSPDGDIAEDEVVSATGTYDATASLSSGGWVMQIAAFRQAGSGGTGGGSTPTAPGNLTATAVSSTQINLSWTASTETGGTIGNYLVERCQGSACTSFAQIGTSTTTTFNDTGLTGSTSYSYRVRARDTSNNTGPYSNTATATTLAPVAPTAPGNLAATAASSTQINLSWTASTDTGGTIGNYLVERCQGSACTNFAQIGTSTTTTFNDTALTGSTSYSYRVRASDTANNTGPYSNTATTTTQAPTWTAPSNLTATAASSSQVNLSWTAATEVGGTISNYIVQRCPGTSCSNFVQVATPATTTFSDTGLTGSTVYNYRVQATDSVGNLSPFSGTATATTPAGPANLTFVQSNYAVPSNPQTAVAVIYPGAQAARDTNIVVVGWFDTTSTVTSVTDTAGNSYMVGVGPIRLPGTGTLLIYYATNISAAGANQNSVTVSFSAAAPFPDIRILEYSGINATMPLDGIAGGSGSGTSDSGPVTTSNATDLLFGANNTNSTTSGPGAGFVARIITAPNGDIAEDEVVSSVGTYDATAPLSSGDSIMELLAFRAAGSPQPTDTTAPTTPADLAAAEAGSNEINLVWTGSTDADSPVSSYLIERCQGAACSNFVQIAAIPGTANTSFNDVGLLNSTSYSYRMRASDPSNNLSTYSSIATAITGAQGTPSLVGQWAGPFTWPMVGIHMTLMPTGKVLTWEDENENPAAQVWDPNTMAFTAVPYPTSDLFCSGHTVLPDGRVMVAGGHNGTNYNGIPALTFFDPNSLKWSAGPNMSFARWYPTVTGLPDGRELVTSGAINCQGCNADTPELYDPKANTWTSLNGATNALPIYPHMFVTPDGRVLVTGSYELPVATQALDVNTQTWTTIDPNVFDEGSAVMYLPGKIMKSGTSANSASPYTFAVSNAYVLDMTQPSPAWQKIAPMAFARSYHNMTLLPDGTVLVTGGQSYTNPFDVSTAVFAAELWSPTTQKWTTMSSMQTPRVYHSTALLLPDGRVLVAGSGEYGDGSINQLNAEIYSPPYLFNGARPSITSAPATVQYAQPFSVVTPDAANIASVSLLRLGSVTHGFNQNQRYLPLSFTAGSGSLTITGPASSGVAPPGYYMLFIVNSNGVPSVASIVQIPVS